MHGTLTRWEDTQAHSSSRHFRYRGKLQGQAVWGMLLKRKVLPSSPQPPTSPQPPSPSTPPLTLPSREAVFGWEIPSHFGLQFDAVK